MFTLKGKDLNLSCKSKCNDLLEFAIIFKSKKLIELMLQMHVRLVPD